MVLESSRFDAPVVKETYDLPGSLGEILQLLEGILAGGGVQSLELEVGKPVKVFRATRSHPEENDLDGVLRNVELFEYLAEDHTSIDKLFGMLNLISSEGLFPACWATGPDVRGILDQWLFVDRLGLRTGVENLMGVPVKRVKSLDEDVLILCGSREIVSSVDDIVLAIKTDIEMRGEDYERDEPSREVDGGVRGGEQGAGGAIHQVEADSRRGSVGGWNTYSFPGRK